MFHTRLRRSRERALTLTDLLLLVGVAALVLSLLWPRQTVARLVDVEAELATWLLSAGEQLEAARAAAKTDVDGDGQGEYPALETLALDGLERADDELGFVRNGYYVVLLRPDRRFQAARPEQEPKDPLLVDLAEAGCALIAWPQKRGKTGMRAYCWSPADGLLKHTVDGYPYDSDPPPFRGALVERADGGLRAARYQGEFWVHPPRSRGQRSPDE